MKKKVAVILVTIWAIAIGVGIVWITDYSMRPGEKSASPVELSSEFIEEIGEDLPKLVLFWHSQCPCSRATLTELDRLVSKLVDVWNYKNMRALRDNPGSKLIQDYLRSEERVFQKHRFSVVF